MAGVNPLNALMFGSEKDALYLGPLGANLDSLTLTGAIPSELEDVGWLSEDGLNLALEDSTGTVKGHQGGGVVKSFMESSETSLTAVLLESKLKSFELYFDTKVKKGTDTGLQTGKKDIATFDVPAARKAREMCAVIDLYDTSTDARVRIIMPHVTLGARDAVDFKIGEITAYKMPLTVIGGFKVITNHPGLIPA